MWPKRAHSLTQDHAALNRTATALTIFISSSSHCAVDLDVTNMRSGLRVSWQAVSLQVRGRRVPVQRIPQPHISRRVPATQNKRTDHTQLKCLSLYQKRQMDVTAGLLPVFHPRLRSLCLRGYLTSPSHRWIISPLTLSSLSSLWLVVILFFENRYIMIFRGLQGCCLGGTMLNISPLTGLSDWCPR